MKHIVFIYDIERSKSHRQFTVRMEERMLSGKRWGKTGKNRVYSASDLVKLKSAFIDPGLAREAMQSEMGIQKTEGRFISADMNLTTLRISPALIKRFLKICASRGAMCNENGDVLNFNLLENIKPDIHIHSEAMDLFLQSKNFLDCDYTIFSGSILVVFRSTLFLFNRNYYDVLRKVPYGRPLGPNEFERAKRLLSQHADDLNFVYTTNRDRKTITSFVPVFDLTPNLKFANLYFNYDDVFIDFDASEKTFTDIDHRKTIKRDGKKEKGFVNLLIQRGLRRQTSHGAFFLSSANRMETLKWLANGGFQLSVDRRKLNLDLQLHLDIRVNKKGIDVGGTVASGQASIEVQDVVAAINENRPLFRFADGGFGLTSPLKDELNALRPFCRGNRITVPRHQFALLSEKLVDDEHCRIDSRFRELKKFQLADERLNPFDPPASLGHLLRPYQAYGYMWLCNLKQLGFGGILADDMGLGKTLQVMALLLRLRQNGARALVVVPRTLVHNWELEILKFAPQLSYTIHRHHRQPLAVDGVDLVITTYGLVRSDVDVFRRNHWDTMILDEAQTIKNYYTDTSRKIRKIPADFRLALTGTPLENSLTDLYSIFEFIMPGFFGSLKAFKQALEKKSIRYYYLDGTTRHRMAIVKKFQQEKKACMFLISLKTGGVGLNLTNANYVFLLDPWWNPAVENQAIDRCYRIGQSDPVTVYRFISKGSIEEKIMTLKERKRQMEDQVINVTDMESIPLSEAELKQLII